MVRMERVRDDTIVNVRHFGAQGDGVTDDRAAIQVAEDAAAAIAASQNTRVTVMFPAGDYGIDGSLVKRAGTDWVGPGLIRRRDNTAPAGAAFSLVTANAVSDWRIDGLSFENVPRTVELAVPLTRNAALGMENSCIDVQDCNRFTISNCRFAKYNLGVRARSCTVFTVANNTFRAMHDPARSEADYEAAMANGTFESYAPHVGGYAIVMDGGTPPDGVPSNKDFLVAGNHIRHHGLDGAILALNQSWDESPGSVVNNVIRGGRSGIQSYRGTYTDPGNAPTWDARVLIANNRVSWTWEQGIYLRTSYGCVVSANLLYRTGLVGDNGSGSSAGGIVTRSDPANTQWSSPLKNPTPTLIVNNVLIDTGSMATMQCDGAIQVCLENTIVRGNAITRSQLPSFVAGTHDYGILVGQGEPINHFEVVDNSISGHHIGVSMAGNINRSRRPRLTFATWRIDGNHIEHCHERGIIIDAKDIGGSVRYNTIRNSANLASISQAIAIKNAPFATIEGNIISGATGGLMLASGNLASDVPYMLSSGAITRNRRRGGTLVVRNNQFYDCGTAHSINETSGVDTSFFGRCAVWEGDTVNGTPVYTTFSGGTPSTTNNAKIWTVGDETINSTLAVGQPPGRVCISSGTCGDMTASTGDTTSGSPVITNVSTLDGYGPGIYITATGFSGPRKIIDIDVSANTITVDANAASSNVGVTLAIATPTFAAKPNLV